MTDNLALATLLKRPSGWLPLAMSLTALMLVLGVVLLVGVTPAQPPHDEQAPARLYQLLMVAQVPVSLWFAVQWLPRNPGKALIVLVLQCVAWLTALIVLLAVEA